MRMQKGYRHKLYKQPSSTLFTLTQLPHPPQFCARYSIPPPRTYPSLHAGPAHRFLISSLPLTSRSFCTATQQQQQQALTQSSPQLPSTLYNLRIRVRCTIGTSHPNPTPHASALAQHCALDVWCASRSVASALRAFCERRCAVRPARTQGQKSPVRQVDTSPPPQLHSPCFHFPAPAASRSMFGCRIWPGWCNA